MFSRFWSGLHDLASLTAIATFWGMIGVGVVGAINFVIVAASALNSPVSNAASGVLRNLIGLQQTLVVLFLLSLATVVFVQATTYVFDKTCFVFSNWRRQAR